MIRRMRNTILCAATMTLMALHLGAQQPASSQPALLRSVGIAQEMNQQVPPDIAFRDENGKNVRLGDYFGKKPIVLSLVYFNCPFICTDVLNGELRAMQGMSLTLGKDYDAVTVSFDPKDGPPEASVKSRLYTGLYGRRRSSGNWHFLTGDQQSITALTNAVGFRQRAGGDKAWSGAGPGRGHNAALSEKRGFGFG